MTGRPGALPGEDVLTLPPAWLRALHPRRGGTRVPPPRGGRAAEIPGILAAARPHVDGLPSNERADPAVRDAARRHLAGEPDAAGAAAVAAVAAAVHGTGEAPGVHRAFADRWHADHGIGFAACAMVELARLTAGDAASGAEVVRHAGGWPEGDPGGVLRHVRRLLAVAPDAEYDDAVRRLADHRTTPAACGLAAYFVPTRRDWVDECVEDAVKTPWLRRLIRLSVADPARLDRPELMPDQTAYARDEFVTLADGVGPDLLGFLLRCLRPGLVARDRGLVLDTMAALPSDAAFGALLDLIDGKGVRRQVRREARRALSAAAARFPVRALRLAAASTGPDVRLFLRDHVAANPELVAAALPLLPGGVRAVVEPLTASAGPGLPEAPPDVLPALPWGRPVKPVVRGLEPPATRGTAWGDGERAAWTAEAVRRVPCPDAPEWERFARSHNGGPRQWEVLLHAPERFALPLLAEIERRARWCDPAVARGILARFGTRAYGAALALVEYSTADHAGLCVPFRDAEVAARMAGRLLRGGPPAVAARAWCDRHGPAAVPYLAPDALGTRTAPRRAAEAALRRIAARHGVDAVTGAFPEAAGELRTVLTAHPARTGLARRPRYDGWASAAALPRVLLRGGERTLPVEAVRTLVELLALHDVPGAGADAVETVCDPGSLAEFGLALFERWRTGGMPSDGRWALEQLARTGDDEAVRALVRALRGWTRRDVRDVVCGLRTLAGIGTDAALCALYETSLKGRARKVRDAAAEVFAEAAAARGLGTEALADRVVPGLGLDADGTVTLDYGPRRFVVGFDDRLAPVVLDGARRGTVPRPTAKDDPVLAPAAHARFAVLRKDVEAVALLQTERLESAMAAGRRWTPDEFRGYAVAHPVVRRIARRLVWLAEDDAGATAFRIAEDGTFADAADETFEPSGTARIGVAHPEPLGAATATWAEILADYEILQPFEQLGRPCLRLTERELDGTVLERLAGLRLLRRDVYDLPARGWTRDPREPVDKGVSLRVADGRHVVVEFEPGSDAATLGVRCVRASAVPAGAPARGAARVRFRDLDLVRTSEALTPLLALSVTPR